VIPVDPTLTARDRSAVVGRLVEAALAVAHDWGATGLLWPFARTETVKALARVSRTVATIETAEATMYTRRMELEAYLAAMPSSRRRKARKEIEAFARAGWTVTEERLGDCYEEGAQLLANVERKYGHRVTPRGLEQYLSRQLETLGDRDVVFACRDTDGTLAAWALMYRWRAALYGRLIGFDYSRLREGREYFALSFWTPIEYAAAHDLARIDLGIGSLPAKVLRGGKLHPLWSAMVRDGDGARGLELRRPDSQSEWEQRFANYRDALFASDWHIPPELVTQRVG
jgi:predicted N-acyltransferase